MRSREVETGKRERKLHWEVRMIYILRNLEVVKVT
jgi:hypothetical protein